jgi:hypothetical protein
MYFKLREIGITGNIFNVIKNMYSNTFFCIRKNNFVLTTPIKNDKGVKQGDSLSPTLFNFFFNENKEGLQHCFNKLNSFCITWRLQINLKKTKIMIFSKGKKDYSKYYFFQNNSQIEIVERYKYLGIVFYFNGILNMPQMISIIKALKAFFSVKSKFNNFQEVPH